MLHFKWYEIKQIKQIRIIEKALIGRSINFRRDLDFMTSTSCQYSKELAEVNKGLSINLCGDVGGKIFFSQCPIPCPGGAVMLME